LWTPTPTPTPTFTPSNTPTPTATPLEGAIAGEGETLLLIADFTYIDADATRIEPNLEREFEDIGIRFVRIHHPILDRDEAREILATYNATLILWGEAARGGVQVEFEARAIELSFTPIQFDQLRVAAFEVNSFDAYIFAGMDSRYIVEFTLGRILYSEEKYDDALEAFDRAVALIPEGRAMDVQAGWLYTLRGRSYEELGDHAAALVEYDTAASLLPDWGGPLTFAASAASFAADFEGAISRATQALDIGLDTPLMDEADVADFEILAYVIRSGAHHYLYVTGDPRGDIEQAKADMDAAIALAEGLRAIDPDYVTADLYAQRAGIWELMGNREAALADYDTALEQMPDSAAIYIMRGIYYHIAEEYDLALADFSRAIELDPNDADAFRNRASTYIDVEEWDLALSDINRSIELDPTYGANYGYRANIYYSLGQYEAAIADFTTTLDLTPDFTDVERAITYAARGAAYLQMGNFEASLSDFDQAITLRPTAFNYVRRGLAHTGLGDYNAALRDFSSAIELDETNDLAYYFRARLYVDQYQDCEKAEADSARLAELGASDAALDQDIATLCHPPSPTPLPQNAPDPMFDNGATITLTSPLPLIVLAEPTIAAAQLGACTAGTTVTAQQTIITSDGRRWVEIDCQGVVGWVEEAKLPKP
ncbi:MAG: tetratricopeptide repeat protein, partial [Chloroflexi bacterium]|nr:tetratricopeptide repeat protein [Chloroflexota bacterium]NOG66407.1 tetratricopeptide repeat protein [Chloroflexota bacterium]